MKHTWKITFLLISMFIVAQIVGLAVISTYHPVTQEIKIDDNISVNETVRNLPYGLEPPAYSSSQSLISFISGLFIAIILFLLLMKYRVEWVLKSWFFVVVVIALSITFNAFLMFSKYSAYLAIILALIFAYFKIFKRDILAHNFSELLIYPGISALFVPILSIKTTIILFVIISIYDIYAVWHAKFMQKMAKYQINELKIFSGFLIPYQLPKELQTGKGKNKNKVAVAMLGGGDVVFPIILSGVVLNFWGLPQALLVTLGATLSLLLLFMYSEKGKFYPAMPFITAGSFLGLLVAYLI
ncbi:MAG: presenilin family intramembrane aspartyl protease [Nanoarchaeota archaeon]